MRLLTQTASEKMLLLDSRRVLAFSANVKRHLLSAKTAHVSALYDYLVK